MTLPIPSALETACRRTSERRAWLARLPAVVHELEERWDLELGRPFEDATCAWVAPAMRRDGSPAILKLALPHMEGRDEIRGLRLLDGDPTVFLLESDERRDAMLLERCEPGTPLRQEDEVTQDDVIAGLLRRFWRGAGPGFRPLSEMTEHWIQEAETAAHRWPDPGLMKTGLHLLRELSKPVEGDVLLATDLHAGNVLSARREPWLAIDPKPFVGDPAYDATQHLLNGLDRLRADPGGMVRRFADLLEVDPERVRLWMFARLAADPAWDESSLELARRMA